VLTLEKKMDCKPDRIKSSGIAFECPKASACHACLGTTPKVEFKNEWPSIIFKRSSSNVGHASSGATHPPLMNSNLPSLTSLRTVF
jgi:hypothetical protein